MIDGKEVLYRIRQGLNEDSDSAFLDDHSSYSYVYEGACEFASVSEALKSTQSITTVADQTAYALNADFIRLYMRNGSGDYFIKYNDGTNDHFLTFKPYEEMIYGNQTDSVTIPSHFTIIDKPDLYSRITGTTTSAGAASLGETTLTDSAADFSNVSAGDAVHNTADGSDGVVLSKTSSTVLVTALFGGTANDYTSSDAYVIQPQGRLQLVLDPPPESSGHTITVQYVQRPAPVFSIYGIYRFSPQYINALVSYAIWKYRMRDREPDFGSIYYQMFDRAIRMNKSDLDQALHRTNLTVNLRKRN